MSKCASSNHVYSLFYRRLHWSLAIIIILLSIVGQQFSFDISEAYRIHGLKAHSTLGTLSLLIVITLFAKRFVLRRPVPTPKMPLMKVIMARSVQFSLYALAIFIPISGAICALHSNYPVYLFGLFDISSLQSGTQTSFAYFRSIHVWAMRTAMFLLFCHAGAALYHHFVVKDKVLKSMAVQDPLLIQLWQRLMKRKSSSIGSK